MANRDLFSPLSAESQASSPSELGGPPVPKKGQAQRVPLQGALWQFQAVVLQGGPDHDAHKVLVLEGVPDSRVPACLGEVEQPQGALKAWRDMHDVRRACMAEHDMDGLAW